MHFGVQNMKTISIWILSVAASLLPLQAIAQSVTVGSDSGVGGDTLVIPVTFVAGADLAGIDLDIIFEMRGIGNHQRNMDQFLVYTSGMKR